MNHARDDFLAGAGRPEDQDRDVGLGGGADPLEDDQHLLVAADHFAETLDRRRLIFSADVCASLEERIEQQIDRHRPRDGPPRTAPVIRRARRTMPNSTSSRRQFSTSRRMRPNVAINDSTSNGSPGRALRNRSRPARSGD